ncbi:MAG: enoyl-ACP reductase [Thermoanaerobaculia bacterium]
MVSIDMSGRRVLVMGVTNKHSLGWAIAERLIAAGATVGFTYQGERLKASVEALAEDLEDCPVLPCDVTVEEELSRVFAEVGERWGALDGVVHAIAFAPREAMLGRYVDTTPADWVTALSVSAYSLVAIARHAEPLMNEGAAMVTLTYYASEKVVPKYNVMGVAKSALEASVRYLAHDLGPKGIRVNAVSAGPVKTVAARSIPGFMSMYNKVAEMSPMKRGITHEEVGNLGLYLLSPLSSGTTGETVYVDSGYHVMGMQLPEE